MKVLYLIDSLEGYGAERSLVEIAKNMKEVIPVFVHLYEGSSLRPHLEKQGIKVYSLNIQSKYGYSKAINEIIPILENEKPEVIHSTLFRADMVARKLKRLYPDVVLVGSFVSNSYGRNRYKKLSVLSGLKLFAIQIKDLFTSYLVDFYISNSNTIKKTNSRALLISKNKVKVIYRGRSFLKLQIPEPRVKEFYNEYPQLKGSKIFLNIGRLQKGKGQADLLYAFKKLSDTRDDLALLIAGEGPYRKELEIIISDLNLNKKVILLGYKDDIADLLELTDYFVFPSYYEGLPGALIEAIIAGKPLIVSNIGENKECVPKDSALFFEPGNIPELTIRMKEALELEDWQHRIHNSLEYARKNFDIKKVSKEYESFYKTIRKH